MKELILEVKIGDDPKSLTNHSKSLLSLFLIAVTYTQLIKRKKIKILLTKA